MDTETLALLVDLERQAKRAISQSQAVERKCLELKTRIQPLQSGKEKDSTKSRRKSKEDKVLAEAASKYNKKDERRRN